MVCTPASAARAGSPTGTHARPTVAAPVSAATPSSLAPRALARLMLRTPPRRRARSASVDTSQPVRSMVCTPASAAMQAGETWAHPARLTEARVPAAATHSRLWFEKCRHPDTSRSRTPASAARLASPTPSHAGRCRARAPARRATPDGVTRPARAARRLRQGRPNAPSARRPRSHTPAQSLMSSVCTPARYFSPVWEKLWHW
mmetsp:Transcript_12797/g.32642  ORF Transcript_12797/g.32642 Transcript_12797/m.32642 type:complete len:203 (+) Transcript_12797:1-609(+)